MKPWPPFSTPNQRVALSWPVLSATEADTAEQLRNFRKTERRREVEDLRELIDLAREKAKSKYTPLREKAKWMRLAGQLTWYND